MYKVPISCKLNLLCNLNSICPNLAIVSIEKVIGIRSKREITHTSITILSYFPQVGNTIRSTMTERT